ncbi:hypothetical protein [Streptomyces sp. Wh19]|nr:hypothetical protein [Streptomyces sp. Wh19]MDV9202481.1 hypothetical protein [Streptomyces sp. Wh19]
MASQAERHPNQERADSRAAAELEQLGMVREALRSVVRNGA